MRQRFVRCGRISHAERAAAPYNIWPYLVNLRRDCILNHAVGPYNTRLQITTCGHNLQGAAG